MPTIKTFTIMCAFLFLREILYFIKEACNFCSYNIFPSAHGIACDPISISVFSYLLDISPYRTNQFPFLLSSHLTPSPLLCQLPRGKDGSLAKVCREPFTLSSCKLSLCKFCGSPELTT